MQDLDALKGKSLAELREIAKVLGIGNVMLKKRELMEKIAEATAGTEASAANDTNVPAFIIQKAVELGVSEIIPVAMEHSVVRLEGDKAVKKAERWQKIAEAAAKQSKRDIIPMVQPVQTMEQMLADNPCDCKLIAYECEDKLGLKAALQKEQALKELLLIIGPEGGISETELQQARTAGALVVSLGKRILRAETAALVAAAAIFYETGDLGG